MGGRFTRVLALVLIVTPALASGSAAAADPEPARELAVPLEFADAARVGNDVFVFGGRDENAPWDLVHRVDLVNNTVHLLDARLPTPRLDMGTFTDGRFVYLAGGSDEEGALEEILRFDPERGAFTRLNVALPFPMARVEAAWTGERALLVGAGPGSGFDGAPFRLLAFDPTTENVTVLEDELPLAPHVSPVAWLNDTLFMLGAGEYAGGPNVGGLDRVLAFTPANGTLRVLEHALPFSTYAVSAATDGERVFFIAGYEWNASARMVWFNATDGRMYTRHAEVVLRPHGPAAVWTGRDVLVAGGRMDGLTRHVLRFDPYAGTVTRLDGSPAPDTLRMSVPAERPIQGLVQDVDNVSGEVRAFPTADGFRVLERQDAAGTDRVLLVNATSVKHARVPGFPFGLQDAMLLPRGDGVTFVTHASMDADLVVSHYDFADGRVTRGPCVPSSHHGSALVPTRDGALIFGGVGLGENGVGVVHYDRATEAFTVLPMQLPAVRYDAAAVEVAAGFLVVGGGDGYRGGYDPGDRPVILVDPSTGFVRETTVALPYAAYDPVVIPHAGGALVLGGTTTPDGANVRARVQWIDPDVTDARTLPVTLPERARVLAARVVDEDTLHVLVPAEGALAIVERALPDLPGAREPVTPRAITLPPDAEPAACPPDPVPPPAPEPPAREPPALHPAAPAAPSHVPFPGVLAVAAVAAAARVLRKGRGA